VLLNGVRKAAVATGRRGGGIEMEPTMAVSLRASLEQVSDPKIWIRAWKRSLN